MHICMHAYIYTYTHRDIGWDKSRLTVVHMENNIIIDNIRINSVLHTLTAINLLLPHPVFIFIFGVATENVNTHIQIYFSNV